MAPLRPRPPFSPVPGRGALCWGGMLGAVCFAAGSLVAPAPGRSAALGEVVKAFCLSAFENELAQAGKTAPQGMAEFACACVADRISSGSSVDDARLSCRQATVRRYAI